MISEDSGLAREASLGNFVDAGCVEEVSVVQSHGCKLGFGEAVEITAGWGGACDMIVGVSLTKVLEHRELSGGAVVVEVGLEAFEGCLGVVVEHDGIRVFTHCVGSK